MNEDVTQLIADCLKRRSKMNEWEEEFVDYLAGKKDKTKFSEKQIICLEQIWERIT